MCKGTAQNITIPILTDGSLRRATANGLIGQIFELTLFPSVGESFESDFWGYLMFAWKHSLQKSGFDIFKPFALTLMKGDKVVYLKENSAYSYLLFRFWNRNINRIYCHF